MSVGTPLSEALPGLQMYANFRDWEVSGMGVGASKEVSTKCRCELTKCNFFYFFVYILSKKVTSRREATFKIV